MSAKATFWAWAQKGMKANHKLVLLSLANYANDDNRCWPSYNTIADETGLSRSSIIRASNELKKNGYIEILHRNNTNGSNTSNVFLLKIQLTVEQVKPNDVVSHRHHHSVTQTPPSVRERLPQCHTDTTLVSERHPNLTIESKKEPNNKIIREYPSCVEKDVWDEFMRVRKKRKAVDSDFAYNRLLLKAEKFHSLGYNVNELITDAIVGGWKDFYEPKQARNPKITPVNQPYSDITAANIERLKDWG
jgi:biotin operon repressor